MKKFLLIFFLGISCVSAWSQTQDFISLGGTNENVSPYNYKYYLLYDLGTYTSDVAAEIEVMVLADDNHMYTSKYSLFFSRHSGTPPGRLDGVSMNYISGKPGMLEVLVFNDKIYIRSAAKWGSIYYRKTYGYGISSAYMPLTYVTAEPAGVVAKSRQPFYYDFDANVKHEYPSLTYDGNVGIGTPNPDAKLTVKGTVHAEEVKVDLNVPAPDYVFEDTYNPISLEEIKGYISSEKHLPEIPSAKQMEANGIDLGDMNMKLLKKVEELTLYVIEQNEIIKQQQEAVELQSKELEQLKQHTQEMEKKIKILVTESEGK